MHRLCTNLIKTNITQIELSEANDVSQGDPSTSASAPLAATAVVMLASV